MLDGVWSHDSFPSTRTVDTHIAKVRQKIEARPDQSLRRPLSAALHMAVREIAPHHRAPDRIDDFLAVLKAFAVRAEIGDAQHALRDLPSATRADGATRH